MVGDLEALDFCDASFDTCVALNSVVYASDPSRAFAELARVTRPGGQVLVCVGSGTDQTSCAARVDALATETAVQSWGGLDLRHGPVLERALRTAGFTDVHVAEVAFDVAFASIDEAVSAQRPAGPVRSRATFRLGDRRERAARLLRRAQATGPLGGRAARVPLWEGDSVIFLPLSGPTCWTIHEPLIRRDPL